jgi:hypothetical protein
MVVIDDQLVTKPVECLFKVAGHSNGGDNGLNYVAQSVLQPARFGVLTNGVAVHGRQARQCLERNTGRLGKAGWRDVRGAWLLDAVHEPGHEAHHLLRRHQHHISCTKQA